MHAVACISIALLGLVGFATSTTSSSSSCAQLILQTVTPLSTVSPNYASFNIDSSRNRAFFDTNWASPQLAYLTQAIGGALIRFGGSGNDVLNYAVQPGSLCSPHNVSFECLNATTATNLFALANTSGNGLIFGFNIHPGQGGPSPPRAPWNATNAASLLRWSLLQSIQGSLVSPPYALELGNEQNDLMSAADQAAAFGVLSKLLDDIFVGKSSAQRPLLVGPDTHGFHNATDESLNGPILHYLADFVRNISLLGVKLDALTHHEYIEVDQDNVVDPSYLDNTYAIATQVVSAVRAVSPSLPIWAGEIGPHNGQGSTSANSICGDNHVCGKFGSAIWYADALGAKAAAGYAAFMRQDLIGADYALINTTLPGQFFPTPDYYLLKLWRDNFANKTTVLSASLPSNEPRTTRAYAFCGGGGAGGGGEVEAALVLLNLDNESSTCVNPPTVAEPGSTMRVFTLTSSSEDGGNGVTAASAMLNGVLLALDANGKLPSLNPALVSVANAFELPPLSITLALVSLAKGSAGSCGSSVMVVKEAKKVEEEEKEVLKQEIQDRVQGVVVGGGDGVGDVPYGLRVDLTAVSSAVPLPFVTLDSLTGNNANVSFTWQLPSGIEQAVWSVSVISRNGVVAWSSGNVSSSTQAAFFPRSLLSPATGYTWSVAVQISSSSGAWIVSEASPFFTSAGTQHWALSSPIWAQTSDGSCGPTPVGSLPSFARFYTEINLTNPSEKDSLVSKRTPTATTAATIESAFIYITGAPPVYNDPWNVTKILGGYALRLGLPTSPSATPIIGIGPGRTSCGPVAMGPCSPVQPYDGFDLTAAAQAALTSDSPLPLHIESYGLSQPSVGIEPAVQAVLVVRFVGNSPPPLVVGTSTANGGWVALNADSIRNPGENKAPPRWYILPQEQVNASCQVSPYESALQQGGGSAGCCAWTTPAAASGAFANGTVPLAGKTTQPLQVLSGVPVSSIVQLGPGWWVADMGGEHQGGIELQLIPAAVPGGKIQATSILVQLGEELALNGSALWQLRAGCKYQDRWNFPAVLSAIESAASTSTLSSTSSNPQFLFAAHHEYSEFRWAEIIIQDQITGKPVDIPLAAINITGWTVRYPYADESAATLTTSSPDLDAVWKFAANTLKVTTLDFIADSNTRQRSLDCQADDTTALLSFYATTSELALPRMVASQIMAIGDAGYISGDWADWTVLPALNFVYDAFATGDLRMADSMLDILVNNHTYLYLVDPSSGLIHNGPGLGALVDTSGGSDDGFRNSPWNAVVQAWSYAAITSIASLASALNRPALASQLQEAAAALKVGFNAAFFNGTAICDGLCVDVSHTSVHSSFYALAFGLVNDTNLPTVWAYVQERSFQDAVGVPCGSYPVQFLLQGLYGNGADHGMAAYNVLTSTAPHSWLNMMAEWDASATMECWLPSELPNLSFSHIWSSSPSFLIPQYFFGFTVTAPGATMVSIQPQPGPVLSGKATLPTVKGPVEIVFRQTQPPAVGGRGATSGGGGGNNGGCFELQTTTPGGMMLRAYVPLWGANPLNVTVSVDGGMWQKPSGIEGDYAYVDGLSSGMHSVSTC